MNNKFVEIEIYDCAAAIQGADGGWPTKTLCVSKKWLDSYAKNYTPYRSADELLTNYTFDEVCCLEAKAREDQAIQ